MAIIISVIWHILVSTQRYWIQLYFTIFRYYPNVILITDLYSPLQSFITIIRAISLANGFWVRKVSYLCFSRRLSQFVNNSQQFRFIYLGRSLSSRCQVRCLGRKMLWPNRIPYFERLTYFRGPLGHIYLCTLTKEGIPFTLQRSFHVSVNLNQGLIVTNLAKLCLERIALSSLNLTLFWLKFQN